MSVHRQVQHVAKAAHHVAKAAADNPPSGGPAWLPGALKIGALVVTAALAVVGADGVDAAEALSEFNRK